MLIHLYKYSPNIFFTLLLLFPFSSSAQVEFVAKCGASKGNGYFFQDEIFHPAASEWADDGISNGKISLVTAGEDLDILFGDALGDNGYGNDGATVILLSTVGDILRVGAFHDNYTDIFSFNMADKEVIWTSHKGGPFSKKVAIYRAECL